ncbi:MAG: mechanosensitive ion channel family protein [Nitrososphaerales archaeon]|nr:mechanosensitive ion channel family protein [Nitrososphaerales archaeon]
MVIDLMVGFIIIIISILLAIGSNFTIKRLMNRIFKDKELGERIHSNVKNVLLLLIILIGLIVAISYWTLKFPTFFPHWVNVEYLTIIAQLSVVALLGRLMAVIVSNLLKARTEKIIKERPEIEKFTKLLHRTIIYFIYTVTILTALYILFASPLIPMVGLEFAFSLIFFFAGLTVLFLIIYALNMALVRFTHGLMMKEPRLITLYTFLRKLILAIVTAVGLLAIILTAFPATGGIILSLLMAAGFASIVIGLAAQSSLSNIISGALISISQPFKIGEAIMFRNEFCFAEDIRLMFTVLRTWDNRRLVVPNSIFQSEVIINYTMGDPTMLVPIDVQVGYESDLDKAMQIMLDIAKKHPDCLPLGNIPRVVVMGFADSGINLRLISRAKDQPTAFNMARELLYQIKKEFDANGIENPYPRRHLVLDRDLKERITKIADSLEIIVNNMKNSQKS